MKKKYPKLPFDDAQRIHANYRTLKAIAKDNAEDSIHLTTDMKWANRPNFYDYPGVDTLQRPHNKYYEDRLQDIEAVKDSKAFIHRKIVTSFLRGLPSKKIKKATDTELTYYQRKASELAGEIYQSDEYRQLSDLIDPHPLKDRQARLKPAHKIYADLISRLMEKWRDIRKEKAIRKGDPWQDNPDLSITIPKGPNVRYVFREKK